MCTEYIQHEKTTYFKKRLSCAKTESYNNEVQEIVRLGTTLCDYQRLYSGNNFSLYDSSTEQTQSNLCNSKDDESVHCLTTETDNTFCDVCHTYNDDNSNNCITVGLANIVSESSDNSSCEDNIEEDEISLCDSNCSSCDEYEYISSLAAKCSKTSRADIDTERANIVFDWRDTLRKWAIEHQVTQAGGLLKLMKPSFPDLPVDSKTILRIGKRVEIEKMGDGEYFNFDLKATLKNRMASVKLDSNTIFLNFNIDELPLYKSNACHLIPIQGWIVNTNTPHFICAAYYRPNKPDINLFMKDFAPDLDELLDNGIEVEEKKYEVKVNCFVCDLPAKAYVTNTVGHTAYWSCERCVQKGKFYGRITFPKINAKLRTDESFACYDDQRHHKGESPLTDIGILMVTQFVLDYMHLVCLGVMRKLLHNWTNIKKKYKFCTHHIQCVDKLLAAKKMWPSDFNRRPRSLYELKRWKATELRNFLLYLGPAVL